MLSCCLYSLNNLRNPIQVGAILRYPLSRHSQISINIKPLLVVYNDMWISYSESSISLNLVGYVLRPIDSEVI